MVVFIVGNEPVSGCDFPSRRESRPRSLLGDAAVVETAKAKFDTVLGA